MSNSGREQLAKRMAGTAYFGQVELFEPGQDDWQMYTERLDQFFAANEIPDGNKKKAVFLTVIGKKAYSLLRNLLAPAKPAEKSYAELLAVMKQHLDPKPLVIAERFRFHTRNQLEGVSVAQYCASYRSDVSFETIWTLARLQACCSSLACLLAASMPWDIPRAVFNVSSASTSSRLCIASLWRPHTNRTRSACTEHVHRVAEPAEPRSKAQPCYRCGRAGHSREKCYFRLRMCWNCGNRGHIAKMCRTMHLKKAAAPTGGAGRKPREDCHAFFLEEEMEESPSDSQAEWSMFNVQAVQTAKIPGYLLSLK